MRGDTSMIIRNVKEVLAFFVTIFRCVDMHWMPKCYCFLIQREKAHTNMYLHIYVHFWKKKQKFMERFISPREFQFNKQHILQSKEKNGSAGRKKSTSTALWYKIKGLDIGFKLNSCIQEFWYHEEQTFVRGK